MQFPATLEMDKKGTLVHVTESPKAAGKAIYSLSDALWKQKKGS